MIMPLRAPPIREIMKTRLEVPEGHQVHPHGLPDLHLAGPQLAAEKVKDDELTAITLHTDGYANDPSSTCEASALVKLCEGMKDKDVFVNTIAYGDYSDFRLLSRIANTGSGACIKAGKISDVYGSLYTSTKTLGSSATPPIEVPLEKEYDYQVFVSPLGRASQRRGRHAVTSAG